LTKFAEAIFGEGIRKQRGVIVGLVVWESVWCLIVCGSLGISNHKILAWALSARWLWLKKTRASLPLVRTSYADTRLSSSLLFNGNQYNVGNGENTCSRLIGGSKEEKLRTWLLYFSLSFHKQGEGDVRCKRISKIVLGCSYTRSPHNSNHSRIYTVVGTPP
jgi:hypothetical protein